MGTGFRIKLSDYEVCTRMERAGGMGLLDQVIFVAVSWRGRLWEVRDVRLQLYIKGNVLSNRYLRLHILRDFLEQIILILG